MDPSCPSCGALRPIRVGPLPDSRGFAGAGLAEALPGGSLYRCPACHLCFRYPVLDPESYRRLYDNSMTGAWAASGDRPDWDRIAGALQRHVAPGRKVLDVGCYSGGLLARLRDRYACHGIEINRQAAAVARAVSGATIVESLSELDPDLRFDAIVVADVIEHVADPAALVRQLMPRLAKGGVLVVSTGDAAHPDWLRYGANWWYCYYAEHIAFVSRDWLAHLGTSLHLVVLECENFAYRRLPPMRRWLEAALMRFYGRMPQAYLALKRVSRRLRGLDDGVTSVPGSGVGADHLLIVLAMDPPTPTTDGSRDR